MKCNIRVCVQCSHDEFIPSLQKKKLAIQKSRKEIPNIEKHPILDGYTFR